MSALAYAIQFLTFLPQAIQAGLQVQQMIAEHRTALEAMQAENRDPSDAEWKALNDRLDALEAQLRA